MNRIGKAVVVAVMMVLLCAATSVAAAADRGQVMRCPSGGGNFADVDAVNSTPSSTSIEYTQSISGVGYECIHSETSTAGGYSGIGTSIYSRGSGEFMGSRVMTVDTKGASSLNQRYDNVYAPVAGYNQPLEGETGIQSYPTGVIVRDRYSQTYDRTVISDFVGDNTQTKYSSEAQTYGKTNFRARIVDTENYHHTVMRVSEKHVGDFITNRTIRVEVTPPTTSEDSTGRSGSVCSGRSP